MIRPITLILLASFLAGCTYEGTVPDPAKKEDTHPVTVAVEAVKLIATDIPNGYDKRTFGQPMYQLSVRRRLLLRLESLAFREPKILLEQPILLRIQLVEAQGKELTHPLELCPLNKNWMMAATWKKAHPYQGGEWKAGGDIDRADCLPPYAGEEPRPKLKTGLAGESSKAEDQLTEDPETLFCQHPRSICYDIRPWVRDYVRASGVNFGFVLLTDSPSPLSVYGKVPSKGPEVFWRELKNWPSAGVLVLR